MEGQTNINVTEIVDAELLLERFFRYSYSIKVFSTMSSNTTF